MKSGKPIKTEVAVTILCDRDGVDIWVEDVTSGIQFLEIRMSVKEFTAALGRLAARPAKATIQGLDKIGLVEERGTLEFPMKGYRNGPYDKKTAASIARHASPKGWEPALSFNSQDSFFLKDDEPWARTTIRRWVPKEEAKR